MCSSILGLFVFILSFFGAALSLHHQKNLSMHIFASFLFNFMPPNIFDLIHPGMSNNEAFVSIFFLLSIATISENCTLPKM